MDFLVFGLVGGAFCLGGVVVYGSMHRRYAGSQVDLGQAQARVEGLVEERDRLLLSYDEERDKLIHLEKQLVGMEADKRHLNEALERHQSEVKQLQRQFTEQFENLANKILHSSQETFHHQSQKSLAQLIDPLREKLKEFQQQMDSSSKERVVLAHELKRIVAVNEQMSLQAHNLTKALKGDVKVQGDWGEIMLDKILVDSGLRKDVDYVTQGRDLKLADGESGGRLKPDVVINLPDNKHVIIDSKVSLTHFERYCGEEDDASQALHLKRFLESMKKHIQDLEGKRYQDTEKLGTPDFVLLFMPIEGAYALAMQHAPELHSLAWNKKVVIVCPTTLFATLRTIASLWRIDMQNKHAQEIARQSGSLYDKFVGFLHDMEAIGHNLERTQKVYDGAFNKLQSGKGNLIARAEKIKALGAKTAKDIPIGLLDVDGANE